MQKSTTARRADGPDKDWPGSRRKRTQCANVTAQLCVGVPSSLPPTPRSHLPLVTFCNCHFIFCLYLFLCISHFSVCMPDCPSLCLSVSVSVRVSVCPSHCLSASWFQSLVRHSLPQSVRVPSILSHSAKCSCRAATVKL